MTGPLSLPILSATSYIQISGASEPSTPGSGARLWAEDTNGHTLLHFVGSSGQDHILARDNFVLVRNTSGAGMTKGQLVYATGSTGQITNVDLAMADVSTTTPAFGMMSEDVANNGFGLALLLGKVSGIDTSDYAEGTQIYLSTSVRGGWSDGDGPGYPYLNQPIGKVSYSHATQGIVTVNINPIHGEEDGTNYDYFYVGPDYDVLWTSTGTSHVRHGLAVGSGVRTTTATFTDAATGGTTRITPTNNGQSVIHDYNNGNTAGFGMNANGAGYCGALFQNGSARATYCSNGGMALGTYAAATNAPANTLIVDNLGVGVSVPGATFHVKQALADTYSVKVSSQDDTNILSIAKDGGVLWGSPSIANNDAKMALQGTFSAVGIVRGCDTTGVECTSIWNDKSYGYVDTVLNGTNNVGLKLRTYDSGWKEGLTIEKGGEVSTPYAFTASSVTISGTGIKFKTSGEVVTTDTTDGSDSKYLQIGAGGAIGADRGAYINLGGNEASGVSLDGKLQLVAGNTANGHVSIIAGGNTQLVAPYAGGISIPYALTVVSSVTTPQALISGDHSTGKWLKIKNTAASVGTWELGENWANGSLSLFNSNWTAPYYPFTVKLNDTESKWGFWTTAPTANMEVVSNKTAPDSYVLKVSSNNGTAMMGVTAKGALVVQQVTESSNTFTGTNIEWSSGTIHAHTLTGNRTFTFSGAAAGQTITIFLTQDGTGTRTVTWPTIRWPAATAPTLTTTAGKADIISIMYDGSQYWGFVGGQNY